MKNAIPYISILVVLIAISMVPLFAFSAQQPYWPDQDWRTSTPEEQGLDSAMITEMLEHINQQHIEIHSFLLIRNGYLVTEVYVHPYSAEIAHPLYSGTKSILSTLIGIAHDEGYIPGVDQKILGFFGNKLTEELEPEKHAITIEHLLTMTSGLQPRPSFPLFSAEDPIKFVLDLPTVHQPGEVFEYNSAAIQLLSAILRQTTGTDVLSYANTKLFALLGISGVVWQTDSQGLYMGATGLQLTPRAMAKLGYLYARQGIWNGQQILSEEWIAKATQKHQDTAGKMNAAENNGYGYLWWMNGFDGYSAHGFGGQYLFVIPESDMIVVFTSGLKDPDFPTPRELVKTYILPAVKSSDPLAPNPQAFQALEAAVEHLEHPVSEPIVPFPKIATQISGKTFRITQDGSGGYFYKNVSLTFTKGDEYTLETLWPNGIRYVVQGGLDNVFRTNTVTINQQPLPIAVKAYWQDEHTFVEYFKDLSQVSTMKHSYNFEGQKLTIDVSSSMGSPSFQVLGEMVE